MYANLSFVVWTCLAFPVAEKHDEFETTKNIVQLKLDLMDGSSVIGDVNQSKGKFPIRTRLGQMNVPLRSLESFEVSEKGKNLILRWENGDRLSAKAQSKVFTLQTLVGPLSVPLKVVRRGQVTVQKTPSPLKPVAVNVSGSYAHQTTAKAFDGSRGSAWSSGSWRGWIEVDLGKSYPIDKIRFDLQLYPAGQTIHEVYISKTPIRSETKTAQLVQRLIGHRKDREILEVESSSPITARYVQIRCTKSPGWFNIRELEVFPLNSQRIGDRVKK